MTTPLQSRDCDWCGQPVISFYAEPRMTSVSYELNGTSTTATVCADCLTSLLSTIHSRGWAKRGILADKPEPARKVIELWQVGDSYQIRALDGSPQTAVEALRNLMSGG